MTRPSTARGAAVVATPPVVALAALLLASAPARAQSCTTTDTAGSACTTPITLSMSMPVTDVMKLTLSGTTTALGSPTQAAYTAGFLDASGPTVTVKANRAYRVQVVGATVNFGYTGSLTNPNKPRTNLTWGTVSGTYPNNAGTAATILATGAAPPPGVSAPTAQLFMRTLWNIATDVPGTYSLVLNFTLMAP